MKPTDFAVLTKLNQDVNHFDSADAGGAGNGGAATMTHQKGNPSGSQAQFALLNITYAFTAVAGVFTAANLDTLQAAGFTNSAMVFFGNTDFQSGYPKALNLVQLQVGTYGTPFVYGRDTYPVINVNGTLQPITATITAKLQKGDVVIPITGRVAGTDYVILSVHRCAQVEYAGLLNANVSNSFNQQGIRYILQDETTQVLAQYQNPLYNFKRSWLGIFQSDSTDIDSNNQPSNFKKNVIDVPLKMGISKAAGLVSYVTMPSAGAVTSLTIKFSTWANNVNNPQA